MKNKACRFYIPLLASLLLSLLLTSCLADYLNDQFGFKAPFYLKYQSSYGTVKPSKKLLDKYTLTAADLKAPANSSDYMVFDGWYLDKKLTVKAVAGTVITEDTTLYAAWHDTRYSYFTITYHSDYGYSPGQYSVPWGTKLADYLWEMNSYDDYIIFEGWYLDEFYIQKAYGSMTVTENIDLWAKWTVLDRPPEYFTIYYHDGYGNIYLTQQVEQGTFLDDFYFSSDFCYPSIQPGYDFGGWYTNPYEMTNTAIYTNIQSDIYLYPLIIARTDTPFIIEYYLLDTSSEPYSYVKLDQYTQYLTGQTDSYVLLWDYRIDALDMQYQFMDPESGTISGDGSSVFQIMYYDSSIYLSQFDKLEAALPNRDAVYYINFLPDSINSFDIYKIREIIYNGRDAAAYSYYKKFSINLGSIPLTEIPAWIFEGNPFISGFYVPETCEKIGEGAFYNCESLYHVIFPDSSGAKSWYYLKEGTEYALPTSDFSATAEFFRTNECEVYLK